MGQIMKHPEWRSRIQQVINDTSGKPLTWGELDCFTFMDTCYEAFFGEHLLDVAGNYSTLIGAVKYYKQLQGSFEEDTIIDYLDNKFTRMETPFIKAGDIVGRPVFDGESSVFGYSFGVVIDRLIAFVSNEGVVFVPRIDADFVWRP
jgi:hypothetical protein